MEVIDSVRRRKGELIDLLEDMIRTPSMMGHEEAIARLLADRMNELDYDSVEIDKVGNVIGVVEGDSNRAILYNGHLDTVPPGEMKDPYLPAIVDGARFGVDGDVILGRGACDMKGALAAMVLAGGVLKKEKPTSGATLIVTGSVMEEAAESLGSKHLVKDLNLRPDVVVVGEATNMDIAVGHRGLICSEIVVRGKSCHASAPDRGVNAIYKMMEIVSEVQKMMPELPTHPILGRTTMSINTISAVPNAMNVVPEKCTISIDTRNTPDLNVEETLALLREVIEKVKKHDPELDAEVRLIEKEERSYTGYAEVVKKILRPFYTDPNNPLIQNARHAASEILGREPVLKPWVFATDSPCFSDTGAITFGFGPGDERFAHSQQDNVRIDDVLDAATLYAQLPLKTFRS